MTHKKYGLGRLVAIVIGNMIGAGAFTTSGFALEALGSRELVMLAWLAGGVIAICGAISYGTLSKEISESGGEYVFLHRKVHPVAGCIAGIVSMITGFAGSIAYSSLAFESYFKDSIPFSVNLPTGSFASLVVIAFSLMHYCSSHYAAKFQTFIVSLKVIALVIFISVAFLSDGQVYVSPINNEIGFSIYSFSTVLMWVFFSYSGFNAAVYIAEHVKNPKVNIPAAMIVGACTVGIFYLVLNYIFLYYAPTESIIGQTNIAAKAAYAIGGRNLYYGINIVITLALFSSISTMMHIGPHVCTKMADDGYLPKQLRSKNGYVSNNVVFLQVLFVLLLIWSSEIKELLSYLGLTLIISTALTVSTVINIKKINSCSWYKFIPPVIFILCTVVFSIITAIANPYASIVTLLTIIIGILVYTAQTKRHVI